MKSRLTGIAKAHLLGLAAWQAALSLLLPMRRLTLTLLLLPVVLVGWCVRRSVREARAAAAIRFEAVVKRTAEAAFDPSGGNGRCCCRRRHTADH